MNCTSVSVANPDIDGIGVRVAVYVQAALAFLILPEALDADGETATDFCEASSTAVLMSGGALLAAAFIQGAQGLLSVYDAIIVLQLSWLSNLTVTLSAIILLDRDDNITAAIFHCLHAIATGAFGIWLFHDIQSWSPGCADEYDLFSFGHPFQATDPKLRTLILAMSGFLVIPVVNIIGLYLPYRWGFNAFSGSNPLLLPCALMGFLMLFGGLIGATEDFIRWNSHAVVGASNQSAWTFGQVSAVLLLGPPIWTLINVWNGSEEEARDDTFEEEESEIAGVVVD